MTKDQEDRIQKVRDQRYRYVVGGSLTHAQYYEWLCNFIGAGVGMVPATDKQLLQSTDPHLNDIPLALWDSRYEFIVHIARGLPLSKSDSVCILKHLAKRRQAQLKEHGDDIHDGQEPTTGTLI